MIPINELEKTGNLYHATPVWKVEYIFDDGLRADLGGKSINGRPYQCLSNSIKVAIDMAKISNKKVFKETGYPPVLGIISFDMTRLSESIRLQLKRDPGLDCGLITCNDFPPESISQVIIANLRDKKPDYVIKNLCKSLDNLISLHQIRYYSEGKFDLIE
jgi:hypothetical protein